MCCLGGSLMQRSRTALSARPSSASSCASIIAGSVAGWFATRARHTGLSSRTNILCGHRVTRLQLSHAAPFPRAQAGATLMATDHRVVREFDSATLVFRIPRPHRHRVPRHHQGHLVLPITGLGAAWEMHLDLRRRVDMVTPSPREGQATHGMDSLQGPAALPWYRQAMHPPVALPLARQRNTRQRCSGCFFLRPAEDYQPRHTHIATAHWATSPLRLDRGCCHLHPRSPRRTSVPYAITSYHRVR